MIILDEYDEQELVDDLIRHYFIRCEEEDERMVFDYYNDYFKRYLPHRQLCFIRTIEGQEKE